MVFVLNKLLSQKLWCRWFILNKLLLQKNYFRKKKSEREIRSIYGFIVRDISHIFGKGQFDLKQQTSPRPNFFTPRELSLVLYPPPPGAPRARAVRRGAARAPVSHQTTVHRRTAPEHTRARDTPIRKGSCVYRVSRDQSPMKYIIISSSHNHFRSLSVVRADRLRW